MAHADDAHLTARFTLTVEGPPTSTTTTTTEPLPRPTALERISGDNQEGLPGAVLADPFIVEVHDENGEPVEGVTITFAVILGGGAVSVVTSTTDQDGRVKSTLTLGTDPGTNKVKVSAERVYQIAVFSAEATTAPSEPMPETEEDITPPVTETMPEDGEITPPTPEPKPTLEFNLVVPSGWSLIHVPLKVTTVGGMPSKIESVADLYDVLGGAETVALCYTYDPETADWHRYVGDSSRGSIADTVSDRPDRYRTAYMKNLKSPLC